MHVCAFQNRHVRPSSTLKAQSIRSQHRYRTKICRRRERGRTRGLQYKGPHAVHLARQHGYPVTTMLQQQVDVLPHKATGDVV